MRRAIALLATVAVFGAAWFFLAPPQLGGKTIAFVTTTASNTVPASSVGQQQSTIDANALEPAACTMNPTPVVVNGTGTAGNDLLLANAAGMTLNGNGGQDCMIGGAGADTLRGTATKPATSASATAASTSTPPTSASSSRSERITGAGSGTISGYTVTNVSRSTRPPAPSRPRS